MLKIWDSTYYYWDANELKQTGNLQAAIITYNLAIKLNSNNADAYLDKGIALRLLRKPQEAIRAFNTSIKLNPTKSKSYFEKCTVLYGLEKHEEIIATCHEAIQINPSYKIYNALGTSLQALGKIDKAVLKEAFQAYDEAYKIRPNSFSICKNRAHALLALGKFDESLLGYQKSIQLNPNHAGSYHETAYVLYNLKVYKEAVEYYQRAIELNPSYGTSHYFQGLALYALGREEEAIAAYHQGVKCDPEYANGFPCSKSLILCGQEDAIAIFDEFLQMCITRV